jgi:hypothetical protein
MCSFFMNGVCVVGKACRFAHSQEELEEAKTLMQQAASENLIPAVPVPEILALENQTSSSAAKESVAAGRVAKLTPMKVVIDASWADDLQEVPEGKNVQLRQPERRGEEPQRRSRARRVVVDTSADLNDLEAAAEPVAIAAQTKLERGALVVAGSSGLMDLASRHRKPVVVLDIEDAQEICQGCDKFLQRPANETSYVVEIKRRKGTLRRQLAGASKRSSSCSSITPVQTACSSTARRERSATDALPSTSWCHRGYGVRCDAPAPACAICKNVASSCGQKCAACNSGVRVIQQNTFLTITDDTEDELRDVPFRRTKSL